MSYNGQTKEIIQCIPRGVFLELDKICMTVGVNAMRDEVAKLFVDKAVLNKWYGCALCADSETSSYYIKHTVSMDFKDEYIRN